MKGTYSILKHGNRFDTEEKCREFLMHVRWEEGVPTCPDCGNRTMNYFLKTRQIYKCSKCRTQFSLTKGTIFERSKLPLTKWFMAIYLFTTKKRGVSAIQLARWIEVQESTAWYLLHRLREALKDENNIILHGTVEVDEVFVAPQIHRDRRLQVKKTIHNKEQDKIHGIPRGRRLKNTKERLKSGRKKGTDKAMIERMKKERGGDPYNSNETKRVPFEKGAVILGMLEKGGRIVMKRLGQNTKSVRKTKIYPLLKKHISSDADLVTDENSVYDATDQLFKSHKSVNHKKTFVDNGVTTNGIENAWKQLEASIDGTYTHISYKYVDRYLNEHTFRWNRQNELDKAKFDDFMTLVAGKRITYNELKAAA